MVNFLRERIEDENFLALIWKFLRAGYMEQWQYHRTYSGTPQGSGVSPILAIIYLDKLDYFMAQYKNCFDIGSSKNRKADSGYTRSRGQYHKLKKSFAPKWQTATPEEKAEMDCRMRKTKNEMLYVPKEKWMRKLLEYHAFKIKLDENGKETWKTIHQGKLINHPDIEIISKFNAEIRGLYHYCQLAHNVSVLGKFAHIMEYSMYKTFACKYRATVSKIID